MWSSSGFIHILESDRFFPGVSTPWKFLENQFAPGKLKLKVLESTGK